MKEILLDNLVHVKIMESWTFYDLLIPEGQKYFCCLWLTLFINTYRGHSSVSIFVYHMLDTADPLHRQLPRLRTANWKSCFRPTALQLVESANAEGWLYASFYIILWKTLYGFRYLGGFWNQSPVDAEGWLYIYILLGMIYFILNLETLVYLKR